MFCERCNTSVDLREPIEDRGYPEALITCFDTGPIWNFHEENRRDLPDGSTLARILEAPGDYEVDWWSPRPGEDWEPVILGESDNKEDPDELSHLP